MNKIPNRQAICEVLMKHAETDKDIVVLCSDSRGSASLTPFANAYPEQFVEMGIAEQDLVSVSAGLAKCGKKAFAASPACFLSTRSYEQAKIATTFYWHFLSGQILKYLWRWPLKERPLQDLKKARWYLDKLINDVEAQDKQYIRKEASE